MSVFSTFDSFMSNWPCCRASSGKPYLMRCLAASIAVADFDARGFAAHGVREEYGDVVAVFGDAGDVLL